jgi:dipeptidyl aminopeptidase/acylaminoacyl peptidase
MSRVALLFAALALPALPLSAAETASGSSGPRPFQAADIFQLEYADDPQISPDGRRIAYVRTWMDIKVDQRRSNIWIVNSDGSGHRPLLSGQNDYSSPRWSPDGTRLAYVSGVEGAPQIYVRWMDTGQTALLTNLTEAPSAVTWSPDGRHIAFSMFVRKDRKPLAEPPKKPEGAEWAPPVKVVDSVLYRADGRGFLESGYRHLFILSAEGGAPRQLTDGDFNHGGPLSWTPDGRHIVFSTNRSADWEYDPLESDVYRIAVADGELTRLTDRKGPDREPRASPDGRRIAYTGFDDREQGFQTAHLYLMDRDGGNVRAITADFDREIESPQWAADGRGLYFLYDDRGVRKLGYVSVAGKIEMLAENIGGLDLGRPYTSGSYTIAQSGAYAITVNSPHRPADVAAGGPRRAAVRLTRLNDDLFGHRKLGEVRAITWKSSHDQREIEGWVVTPPDFDPSVKYPLILEIHGGPFAAYGPNFTAEIQLFAAAGYVVLYANPRGSTSYGEEFANLIHHAYPGNDYDDLMSGVDAVLAEGYVDPEHLFVTGGSGGGVLTAWIIGRTDRFRAAVVAKPVINWTSFALTADFYTFFHRYWFPGPPWEVQQEYWRRSPLSLVGNVTTPTMLLTGEADYRTPMAETEQYYQALKLRKVDAMMVRVPDVPHGIVDRPSNLIAKAQNIIAWFDRYRYAQPDQGK